MGAADVIEAEELGPVRGECGECGAPVVVAQLRDGRDVVLDGEEVMPPGPCPLCKKVEQQGHGRGWCWRCHGTNVIGEPLPEPGVCIDQHGHARVFRGHRKVGEAVHRIHPCGLYVRRAA